MQKVVHNLKREKKAFFIHMFHLTDKLGNKMKELQRSLPQVEESIYRKNNCRATNALHKVEEESHC